MISSSANCCLKPSPSHSGHAPKGELKENDRGSKSGSPNPNRPQRSLLQTNFRDKSCSSPSMSRRALPSARLQAISRLSASRVLRSSDTFSRSMTTSIVCFFCLFSSGISSERSIISPLIRARINPRTTKSWSIFLYSPLRPRTTGAKICNLVPLGFLEFDRPFLE